MTTPEKIVQKLDSDLYPELNADMIFKLTNESERGAVLIGTSKIEEFLEQFVVKILPKESNNYKKKLLEYPGPLSSFSSKIELLYAFRYINEQFYNALNILRRLRNDAAHSYNDFNLEIESQKIEEIIGFVDEDLSYVITEISMNNLLEIKKGNLEKIYNKRNFPVDHEDIRVRLENFKTSSDGLKQHRIWKLSYGIVFMCLYVLVLIDENDYLTDCSNTHPINNHT